MKPLSIVLAILFAVALPVGQGVGAVDAVTPPQDRTLQGTDTISRTGDPVIITRPLDAVQPRASLLVNKDPSETVTPSDVEDAVAATVNVANTPNAVGSPDTDTHATAITNTPLAQVVAVLFALAILAALVYWASRVAQYRHDHPETIRPKAPPRKDTAIFS